MSTRWLVALIVLLCASAALIEAGFLSPSLTRTVGHYWQLVDWAMGVVTGMLLTDGHRRAQ